MSDLLRFTSALFSRCRTYRYLLLRQWAPERASLCFLMLNPSTADETANDPTVERCERRAVAAGYGGLIVVNLFALRSTDPRALYRHADPVGPENDRHILEAGRAAGRVICAWGQHGRLQGRGEAVLAMLQADGVTPHALKVSKDGQPSHPLYLPYTLEPQPYRAGSVAA